MSNFRMYGENPGDSGMLDESSDKIEEPIIPINELGVTVPENDPSTGGHVLQNIEAAIRKGASTMQLMWSTPSQNAIGGRPKAYGKDVRAAIRELLDANQVTLAASELPTSSNTNMSGFNPQDKGTISEEKRQRDLREVKDAIDFQVEVGGGGGIDIWSQEFMRTITDDKKYINKNDKYQFFDYSQEELDYEKQIQEAINDPNKTVDDNPKIENIKYLYDQKTGQIIDSIKKSSKISKPIYVTAKDFEHDTKYGGTKRVGEYDEKRAEQLGDGTIKEDDLVDASGNWIDHCNPDDFRRRVPKWNENKMRFESQEIGWAELSRQTKEYNKRTGSNLSTEEFAFREQMDGKVMQARGQSLFHSDSYEDARKDLKKIHEQEQEFQRRKEELKQIFGDDKEGFEFAVEQEGKKYVPSDPETGLRNLSNPEDAFARAKKKTEHKINYIHELSASQDAQAADIEKMKESVVTPDKIAGENTKDSYAELGLYAMQKSRDPKAQRDVYVGPELGWPTAFGGHPEEFIEIVKGAREKMVEKMTKDEKSEFYNHNMTESEAREYAKKHIRGDFDTSHMAMWYNHFAGKKNESEEEKLKRFNKWYGEMVDKLAEEDVVGSIQVVDAITGQHSHLPPGQGKFPVVDAVKRMKKKGWEGDIVSEGHEEEKFGAGRIMTETWKAFGAPVGGGYWGAGGGGMPKTWGGIQNSYFGATQPPTYIVGAYVPSNEWSLWSETPFE